MICAYLRDQRESLIVQLVQVNLIATQQIVDYVTFYISQIPALSSHIPNLSRLGS